MVPHPGGPWHPDAPPPPHGCSANSPASSETAPPLPVPGQPCSEAFPHSCASLRAPRCSTAGPSVPLKITSSVTSRLPCLQSQHPPRAPHSLPRRFLSSNLELACTQTSRPLYSSQLGRALGGQRIVSVLFITRSSVPSTYNTCHY